MGLSNDQIKKIASSRPHEEEIQRGIQHQQRLKFHSETVIRKTDFREAYRDFTDWVGNETPEILPRDKFERFKQLIRPPIPTIELTESIYSRLFRIFFSQNNFFHYEFTSPELGADWEEFRDDTFWRTKGFKAMCTAIDSVWVVDLPEEQLTPRPQPFGRLINIENIIDISNNDNNDCEYVIYSAGDKIVAYDDELIRVYDIRNSRGGRGVDIDIPEKEIPHDLGYTPARMFWSEQLHSDNYINKESPLTKELSDLDWLLFHMISKKYMELCNSYPILVKYEDGDDYEDPDRTANKDRADGDKRPMGNKMIGAGGYAEVPLPRDNTEFDPMKNPIKYIAPEVEALEWHVKEETRLKDTIFKSVVGTDTEVRNDAAKNEKQIDMGFESQKSVLLRIKKNFEIINTFADNTIAKLRYGDQFIGSTIDYGSDWFLKSVGDLHEDRMKAREGGAGEMVIANISDKILNTEYKEDHESRQRAEIVRDLDPLPEKDLDEVIKIFENGGIDKINFIIKSNLINFVRRFERENISLVKFAQNIDYAKKITLINEKFKDYASEQRSEDTNQRD